MISADFVMEEIKKGMKFTVYCTMYDETISYRDGSYYSLQIEKGSEGPGNEMKWAHEEALRKYIDMWLRNSEFYDWKFEVA